ncbi:family 10 glycosylhydrolase [bacterium]|nr:family 10 glycosylhydrolase [bacterium]
MCMKLMTRLLAVCATWLFATAGFAQDAEATFTDEESKPINSAIWVTAEGDWLHDTLPVERLVGELRDLAFQEVIAQVVENGSACYRSSRLPKAPGLTGNFDALDRLTKELHKKPKRKAVLAWIDPFRVGNVNSTIPVGLLESSPDSPNWLAQNQSGATQTSSGDRFLEPGLPEVRAILTQVMKELAQYPIDGIYIDAIADPGADWGYHPTIIKMWQSETGRTERPAPNDPQWIAFRAKMITDTLTEMAKAARSVKRDIVIAVGGEATGPAPASLDAFKDSLVYKSLHQDWPQWLKSGLVNRVYVKNFQAESNAADLFTGWLGFALAADKELKGSVYVGVAGYQNDSIAALRQMQRVALSGAGGVALANFQHPEVDPGVRKLFFDAAAETALSAKYVARMHQLATLPRGEKETSATGELELPPPPSIEEGQTARLIPIPKKEKEDDALAAARRLAGLEPITTGTTVAATTSTLKTEAARPAPSRPRALTRHEMLVELLKQQAQIGREIDTIKPTGKAEDYLKKKYGTVFEGGAIENQ